MNWTTAAVLSAVIYAAVNILDSHILGKRMPGLRAFLLPICVIHLTWACIVLFLNPLPPNINIGHLLGALATGALRVVAATIMLYELKKGEVAQVIPVVYSSPIFVAIIAMPLLGEMIGLLQWLAVVIVVAGTMLVSAQKVPHGLNGWIGKFFFPLILSSLIYALADITGKYALQSLSYWNVFSLSTFAHNGIFLVACLRPDIIKQLLALKPRKTIFGLVLLNETLTPIAIILSFWAMERGPISLVSAILGSRPAFVALFAFIISRILPEFITNTSNRSMLALRFAATVMIVAGVVLIYIT